MPASMMTKKKKMASAIVGLIGILTLGTLIHTNTIHLPFEQTIEVRLVDGLEDDRVLAGVAHVVFVGKVTKKISQTMGETGPLTQFDVQVIQNIKGELSESIVINQEGGYRNGILSIVENQPLLQIGTTYILAARSDGKGNYLAIPYPRAQIILTTDTTLSSAELTTLAATQTNVLAMEEAYRNEIPFQIDIELGNDINSYTSTQTE
jgi:hypothetical protein